MSAERPRLQTWLPAALLAFFLAWSAIQLGLAIAQTGYLEQDSIYYAEVAERIAAGDGATSLADRRGFAFPRPWPQPFEATTLWPHFLAVGVAATGWPAWRIGQLVNLLAFLLGIPALAWLLWRAFPPVPFVAASLAAGFALSTQWGVRSAVVNESDGASLFVTILALHLLVPVPAASRPSAIARWFALGLVSVVALSLRLQNLALAVPLAWLLADALPPAVRRPVVRARPWLLLVGAIAVFATALPDALDGLAVFVDPGERGSYLRTMRALAPAGLVGIVLGLRSQRYRPVLLPFVLLALGHLLILLANPDPNGIPRWLFGIRHGLPFHIANIAGVAVVCALVVGRWRTEAGRRSLRTRLGAVLLFATLIGGLVDNLPRADRLRRRQAERTELAPIDTALRWMREHPLPEDSVLAAWNCDVFAYHLRRPTLHLRGFSGDRPETIDNLVERATHAVFVTVDTDHREVVELQSRLAGIRDAVDARGGERLWSHEEPGYRVSVWRIGR